MKILLLSCCSLLLASCCTKGVVVEKVPVPVSCIKSSPQKPEECKPKEDTLHKDAEWLRCELANSARNKAYVIELEAVLEACK